MQKSILVCVLLAVVAANVNQDYKEVLNGNIELNPQLLSEIYTQYILEFHSTVEHFLKYTNSDIRSRKTVFQEKL